MGQFSQSFARVFFLVNAAAWQGSTEIDQLSIYLSACRFSESNINTEVNFSFKKLI